jgi:predicted transcriptional regulator
MPLLMASLSEAFKAADKPLPSEAMSKGIVYKPVLLAQTYIRYLNRKYNLDYEDKRTALVTSLDRRGVVRWDEYPAQPIDPKSLDSQPAPETTFATLEAPLSEGKTLKSLQKDFIDWAYRTSEVQVWANQDLKLFAGPELSEGEFRKLCSEEAREKRDAEIKKLKTKYKTKIERVQKKLSREKRELTEDEADFSQRKLEELGTHAENLLGLFGGSRRRVSSSLTKRRMTSKAKADVEESKDAIEELENDLAELAEEIENLIDEIEDNWGEVAGDISQLPVSPLKKDIHVDLFGVAWMPFHNVEVDGKNEQLPGFGDSGS